MQNQIDKTTEKKRLEARMALEGEERKKDREEAQRKEAEGEKRKVEEEARQKQKEEEKEKQKELEKKRKKEEEEKLKIKKETEKKELGQRKEREEEEKKTRQKALLKKITPQNRAEQKPEEVKVIQRVVPKDKVGYEREEKIPRIRTFKNDVSKAVKQQNASLVTIALAEKKKAQKNNATNKAPAHKKSSTKILILFFGVIIVITSGGALIYQANKSSVFSDIFNNLKKTKEKTISAVAPNTTTFPSLISADTKKEIKIPEDLGGSGDFLEIIKKEMKNTSGIESIRNIYLLQTETVMIEEKEKKILKLTSVKEILSLWQHSIPPLLSRSLSNEFMLGIYSSAPKINTPFLILTTKSSEQTFAGMFAWEKSIFNDFYSLFSLEKTTSLNSFRDIVVKGIDSRVLYNVDDEIILLYAFTDENTVVITSTMSTFNKILSKLNE